MSSQNALSKIVSALTPCRHPAVHMDGFHGSTAKASYKCVECGRSFSSSQLPGDYTRDFDKGVFVRQ